MPSTHEKKVSMCFVATAASSSAAAALSISVHNCSQSELSRQTWISKGDKGERALPVRSPKDICSEYESALRLNRAACRAPTDMAAALTRPISTRAACCFASTAAQPAPDAGSPASSAANVIAA
eukprot:scaffold11563_cov37-Prasinocladus_malaysianus.AAC.1